MEKMCWKKTLALLLVTVSLSGIVGCQGGKKTVSSASDGSSGVDDSAGNRAVASMGAVSLSQKQVINYLQSLDSSIVTGALNREGGLEDLARGAVLRKNIVTRATNEGWLERADVKTKIADARRNVLSSMYLNAKSEPPAGYPDDATVAKVYETTSQRQAAAGKAALKPLEEIAPVIKQRLREKQKKTNEQNYLKGLVSSNPITVDLKKLVDFINLSQQQKQQQAELLKQPVARMGNMNVSLELALKTLRGLPPAQQRQVLNNTRQLQQFMHRLARKYFILNEAIAAKFNARPAVKNNMEQARLQVIYTIYMKAWSAPESDFPGAALVEESYQKNLGKLVVKDRYLLAKIIMASSGDSAADELKAKQVAAAARARGADFAALARQYSRETGTAKAGGQVGWINTEALLPEMSRAIRGNQTGAVVGPIHNKWGWQIIKILDHKPAHQQTLEEARPALVAALRKQRSAAREKQILEQLVASEPVTVDRKALQQVRQQVAG